MEPETTLPRASSASEDTAVDKTIPPVSPSADVETDFGVVVEKARGDSDAVLAAFHWRVLGEENVTVEAAGGVPGTNGPTENAPDWRHPVDLPARVLAAVKRETEPVGQDEDEKPGRTPVSKLPIWGCEECSRLCHEAFDKVTAKYVWWAERDREQQIPVARLRPQRDR